jgi:hypothetical protein
MAGGGARTELGKKLLQRSSWLLITAGRLGVFLQRCHGVRAARDRPATGKLGRRHSSPAAVSSRNPDVAGLGIQILGSGSFWAVRGSGHGGCGGPGCSGTAGRR